MYAYYGLIEELPTAAAPAAAVKSNSLMMMMGVGTILLVMFTGLI